MESSFESTLIDVGKMIKPGQTEDGTGAAAGFLAVL